MKSAFGVDHGEIEKAFGFAGLGSALGRGTAAAGQGLRRAGARTIGAQRANMGRMSMGRTNAGVGQVRAGGALRKLGQGMQQRPGLTGGIAAGGAAAGAGGFMANRKKY